MHSPPLSDHPTPPAPPVSAIRLWRPEILQLDQPSYFLNYKCPVCHVVCGECFLVMLNRRRHAAMPTEEYSEPFSYQAQNKSVLNLFTITHPRWHLRCFLRDHHNMTSRTSQRRKFRMHGLGSRKVRSSVSINPPASSTYPHPARNRPPPGSPSVRMCSAIHSATRKTLRLLRLSAAIIGGYGSS